MSPDFYSLFIEPFSDFSFMQRALWGCVVLSLSATPIGVFLTLRRMSLTGDAMAHAILPGAAIGFLISGLSVSAIHASFCNTVEECRLTRVGVTHE